MGVHKIPNTQNLRDIEFDIDEQDETSTTFKVTAKFGNRTVTGFIDIIEDRGPPPAELYLVDPSGRQRALPDGVVQTLSIEFIEKLNEVMHPVYVTEVERIMG